MIYTEPGVWAVWDYDNEYHHRVLTVHAEEVDALRMAISIHDAYVAYLPFGVTIREAADETAKP